jgi:hypothetical protein
MNDKNNGDKYSLLDEIAREIRESSAPPDAVHRSAARVWEKLEQARGHSEKEAGRRPVLRPECEALQRLFPDYLAGSLAESKAFLVRDHTLECLPCRKALQQARRSGTDAALSEPVRTAASPEAPKSLFRGWVPMALAATLLIAFIGSAVLFNSHQGPVFGKRSISINSLNGLLFTVTENGYRRLEKGQTIPAGQVLKTAKGSWAQLALDDGTTIEMNERTALSLGEKQEDVTLNLGQGAIIVEAAPQKSGLFVKTEDCQVKVTGTIFAISSGTAGSRVSVVEGDVQVRYRGNETVLRRGEQLATGEKAIAGRVVDDIGWSRRVDVYMALLKEVSSVQEKLEAEFQAREPALSPPVVGVLPEHTAAYCALPNLGRTFFQAKNLLMDRITGNPLLRQWWDAGRSGRGATADDVEMETLLRTLEEISGYLGQDFVLAVLSDAEGRILGPAVLADVKPENEPALLRSLRDLQGMTRGELRLLEGDPARAPREGEHPYLMVRNGIFAASPNLPVMTRLADGIDRFRAGLESPFARTAFARRIADAYREGPNFVFAVDIENLLAEVVREETRKGDSSTDGEPMPVKQLRQLGLMDLEHLVFANGLREEDHQVSCALTFKDARKGIASWLAEPAPMGSLDFVSPEATLFFAVAVKNPAAMVQDIFSVAGSASKNFPENLAKLERKLDLNIIHDIAEPLGGELMVALDGPILPVPAWKAAVEVYDADRLQRTVEQILDVINREKAERAAGGGPCARVQLTETNESGRRLYRISCGNLPEIHYTYVGGYLVATGSRPILLQTIESYEAGATIRNAPEFVGLLPATSQLNFSLLAYQNMESLVSPLAQQIIGTLSGGREQLSEAQGKEIEKVSGGHSGAALVYGYGRGDRIDVFGNSKDWDSAGGMRSVANVTLTWLIQNLIEMKAKENARAAQ